MDDQTRNLKVKNDAYNMTEGVLVTNEKRQSMHYQQEKKAFSYIPKILFLDNVMQTVEDICIFDIYDVIGAYI